MNTFSRGFFLLLLLLSPVDTCRNRKNGIINKISEFSESISINGSK